MLLALAFVLPPLAFALTSANVKLLGLDAMGVMVFVLLLAVVVWSPGLVARGQSRLCYDSIHFPLHPAWPLLVTFVFQGLIVTLIGAYVGWWGVPLPAHLNILIGALYFGAIYLLATSMARAVSLSAGMVACCIWGIFESNDVFVLLCDPYAPYRTYQFEQAWGTCQISSCVLMAGLIAFLLLVSPKRRLLSRRIIAVTLLVLAMLWYPVASAVYQSNWFNANGNFSPNFRITTADGSVAVQLRNVGSRERYTRELRFIDYRTRQRVSWPSPPPLVALGFIGRQSVLLLGQGHGEKQLTLYRWQMPGNVHEVLFSIPARRDVLHRMHQLLMDDTRTGASVSPDGRYVLLQLPALVVRRGDESEDIWLLDLAGRTSHLLVPAVQWREMPVSWLAKRAILSGPHASRSVALPGGAVTPWPIPMPQEARR
jgi:hypothetical protein